MDGVIGVELVDAQVVRPLRRAVLRPDQPAEMSVYPGDDDPRSAHAAVRLTRHITGAPPEVATGDVVAVGSVLPGPAPWEPRRVDGWRIRGMATHPDVRHRGLGRSVLEALLDHVVAHEGGLVWCNARLPARNLYARAGLDTRGDVFDIPGIGPHIHMWRALDADRPDGHLGRPAPPVPT
jgi:GNAT superfamily N-acetyltransferase